jgi:acyl-coenzyme A synthetase/AMP-(fatty) acid ligase/3-hydroxymyristoyl/3-hydroxydecanoyl-(acyl carrier protein) dehydratase
LGGGFLCLLTNSPLYIKLYPVFMNGALLAAFGSTLFAPPVMIYRFATLQDKSIKGSLAEKRIAAYCRKVTWIWCGFFVLNGGIAFYTVFFASDVVWSIYNGGISYILIGILFAGEFIVRKMTDKKMPKAVPLSRFTSSSRPEGAVLCYEGRYSDGKYKTWKDFLRDTAILRAIIRKTDGDRASQWLLHCEDCWHFLASFTSLLQCGKEIMLTANISPAYIAEIRAAIHTTGAAASGGREIPILTDQDIAGSLNVPALLEAGQAGSAGDLVDGSPGAAAEAATEAVPSIKADDTVILMYTSGTTGRPKVVRQRLTEFENDNAFVLSQWGEEFLSRKVVSTVSQHHIYGLLFSILLPFTVGVPFRRRRIEFPEEFESLIDESYMIITVPAFLKRAVEIEAPGSLHLRSPWIFTSGGAVPQETAAKTDEVFGFWPLEVYGSTETSGIAWRQSKNGMEWIPFANAQISKNEEGCLVIRSPYIRDSAGFTTGDLADIREDGRFLLRGRADSIVKIEEKRISLPEVENRILQSALAADVCVLALSGRRQYLAAAIVLNDRGKEQFRQAEKLEINRYFREYLAQFFEAQVLPKKWRYPDALPADAQGKKKKADIEALFNSPVEKLAGMHGVILTKVLYKTENAGELTGAAELFIPAECEYYDGHFPRFKLLPAVAQFELAVRLGAHFFGTSLLVKKTRRIKFSTPIFPNTAVVMTLNYNREASSLSFKIRGAAGEEDTIYAGGTLILAEPS